MAKKASNKGKKLFATYKALGSYSKNKVRKISRHLKQFPNDELAQQALKSAKGAEYTRKPSNTRSGWVNRRDERFTKLSHAEAKLIAIIKKNETKIRNSELYDKAVQETQRKLNNQPNQPATQTNHKPNKKPFHKKSK